jgi:hypothetical protein
MPSMLDDEQLEDLLRSEEEVYSILDKQDKVDRKL